MPLSFSSPNAWVLTLTAILATVPFSSSTVAIEPTQVVYRTVGDVDLVLDVFRPEDATPFPPSMGGGDAIGRPAIVFFFGGGWNAGSPSQFYPHCELLAERGMVAMAADYRVKSRHGVPAIECVRDAKAAIAYVRANAKELGVDPNRIAAGGGSAGGHLAAAIATVKQYDPEPLLASPMPNALVLFNPALMLVPPADVAAARLSDAKDLTDRIGADPETISPYHHVTADLPPTIIFHGKADSTVPYLTAELFAEKADALGAHCVLKGYENQPHGFFNAKKNSKMYDLTTAEMVAFLESIGYLLTNENS